MKLPSKNKESDSKQEREQRFLCQPMRATQVLFVSFANCIATCVEGEWSTKCVWEDVGLDYNCYIAKVAEHSEAVTLLGSDVQIIKLE